MTERDTFSIRAIIGMILLALMFQLLAVPVPIGASGLKMDTHIETSHGSFLGEVKQDFLGYSVAMAGDLNGDGYDDMLLGAYGNDDGATDAGQVYVILGDRYGWTDGTDLSSVDASYWGEASEDYSGSSVAGAGDVNGDGYDDILIGAYGSDESGSDNGQAYLIFGFASGWSMDMTLGKVDASFIGNAKGDFAGGSVAGVGDVNGDGYDDILIGAYGNDDGGQDSGRSYLFFGKKDGWNMDTKVNDADASFYGMYAWEQSGQSVAGAGDVNRDGYDDMLIGAPVFSETNSNEGVAYLVLGKTSGWAFDTNLKSVEARFIGENTEEFAGMWVDGAGDVNGDGYDDMLISAPYSDCDGTLGYGGQTYLVYGNATGLSGAIGLGSVDASFCGEHDGDYAGMAVAGAGDVDRDGYDDILIGDPNDADSGTASGQTYLVRGRATGLSLYMNLGTVAEASFQGEGDDHYAGQSVDGGGDVNGDGYPDILMGAFQYNSDTGQAGKTYLFMPYTTPPIPTGLYATTASDGSSISLYWKDPGYWNEPISSYRIYRSADGSNYKHVGTAYPSDMSYYDSDVSYGATYYYAVVTVDGEGALSDMSETAAITCEADTDQDGIVDSFDPDDDGDTIPDFSDDFPLDGKETLDTDMDGTGNNADNDDDNDGIADNLDLEPLNPLNGIRGSIEFMNTTLQTVQTDVSGMRTDITTMKTDISTIHTDIGLLRTNVTGLLMVLQTSVNALSSNMDKMNASTQAKLTGLETQLTGVNTSLQKNIADLDNDVRVFKTDTAASLKEIRDLITKMNANLTKDIADLEKIINNIQNVTLKQMTDKLTDIQGTLTAMGVRDTELLTKINETQGDIATFSTDTGQQLDDIGAQLENLTTIQQSLDDLEKGQTTAEGKSNSAGNLQMVMLGLIGVTMVLAMVALVRKKKEA